VAKYSDQQKRAKFERSALIKDVGLNQATTETLLKSGSCGERREVIDVVFDKDTRKMKLIYAQEAR
jgi:hypothetical protein